MKTTMTIKAVLLVFVICVWVCIPAFATDDDCKTNSSKCGGTPNDTPPITINPTSDQDQGQTQGQEQAASARSDAVASSDSAATNQGVELNNETDFHSESTNTNIVLVPNNNTADCHKVYGFSFGKDGTAGGVGWPYRDDSCDYEQAADDAAAIGEHTIAWYWRCHKKNLYKKFKHGKTTEEAIISCSEKMKAMMNMIAEPPTGKVLLEQEEYDNLLIAQVQQEEVDELEDKYMKQQSVIAELQKEVSSYDSEQGEIERLKREQRALRAKQEEEETRKARVRERYAKKAEAENDGN